jgi:hypothetical protein
MWGSRPLRGTSGAGVEKYRSGKTKTDLVITKVSSENDSRREKNLQNCLDPSVNA